MRVSGLVAAATIALSAPAALAQDGAVAGGNNWNGFRWGVQGGFFTGNAFDDYLGTTATNFPIRGVLGGVHTGYDVAIAGFVLGIGAEAIWSTVSGAYASATNQGSVAVHRTVTVLGRFGYAMENYLFYAAGGFGFSKVTATSGLLGGPLDTDTVTFHSGLRPGYGWSVGVGLERAFSHGISASIEYRYMNIGDEFIDLAPTHPGETHFVALAGHSIRIGVTIRFGAAAN